MNNYTADFQSKFFILLNSKIDYVVLRNFEGLPERNDSRDIDIALKRSDYFDIKQSLLELVENEKWHIITYLNSDRLVTWVLGKIDNATTELIQLDFFFNTSVFGIELMSSEELINNRESNGKIFYPDISIQFLDKYLYDRAVGAEYPEKYHSTRSSAENSPAVRAKLKAIFGIDNTDQCDSTSGRKLLFRAFRYNLRHRPFGLMADMGRFIRTFTGNYIMSRTGFSVGFTGPDGSGKTTVINRTIQRLGAVFATAHAYYHFRPALFGNLGEVAHSAGIKKDVDRNYSDPHRGGRTGLFSSLMRLAYYSTDYIAGYFAKVKTKTRITRLVIFDRYFTDIICDSRRSRIYLPVRFLNLWRKLFIPSLDYNILLTASSETILSRKRELDEVGIRDINNRIDYLADQKGYLKVLNESTPDDAVTTILNHIFNEQHKKNLRRLK